ncbi:hypothetical protein JCM17823_09620 [Halorubrum gandharaense]
MTFVVPFDGSDLSKTALVRAAQFSTVLDVDVVAVAVIPTNNTRYAREKGWIATDEAFDAERIVTSLRDSVAAIAPDATFEYLVAGRSETRGTIATKLRSFARKVDASIVFLGSENAGRIASKITVGQYVTGDRSYDTLIVSRANRSGIEELERRVSTAEHVD